MGDSKIQWTGRTWNPLRARNKVTGKIGWFCEHVSEGCRNCYAEKMNINTYFGNGLDYKPAVLDQVDLFLEERILQQPLHWRKPTAIFPCSMTDLFGRWVKDEWLDRIFAVMARCPQHTFQILTKRPERAMSYLSDPDIRVRLKTEPLLEIELSDWPLRNVWLGTSCEDQKTADERVPLLLQTPATLRWVSYEPALGPVDFTSYLVSDSDRSRDQFSTSVTDSQGRTTISWLVCGGESGPKARPFDIQWARSVVQQCTAASVPVFVKQLGARPIDSKDGIIDRAEGCNAVRLKDKKGGDINEFPEDLRVRQFPQ